MAGGKETGSAGAIAALIFAAWHWGWYGKIQSWLEKEFNRPRPTISVTKPSDKPYVPNYLVRPSASPTQAEPAPAPTPKPVQAPLAAVPVPLPQHRSGGGSDDFCDWCGCRGGPGYRGPNGQCVGKAALYRVCGNPPTTKCTYEGGGPPRH